MQSETKLCIPAGGWPSMRELIPGWLRWLQYGVAPTRIDAGLGRCVLQLSRQYWYDPLLSLWGKLRPRKGDEKGVML
jgi:hypothetical protein